MTFGARIKKLRLDRGLRQLDVAKHLGCGYTAIGNYERNVSMPSANDLKKLAEFFGVSIDYLTNGVISTVDELEKNWGKGVQLLRLANSNFTQEEKEQLEKYIQFMLSDK